MKKYILATIILLPIVLAAINVENEFIIGSLHFTQDKIGVGTSNPSSDFDIQGIGIYSNSIYSKANSKIPRNYTRQFPAWYIFPEDLKIGIDGLPIVTYIRSNQIWLLKCGSLDCSTYIANNSIETSVLAGGSRIAIGTDGFPVIAYQDGTNGDLKVAKCDDVNCDSSSTTTVDNSANSVGGYASIGIGTDGFPVISYWDGTASDLKVAKCGNADCTSGNTITTVDSTNAVGGFGSLTVAPDGLPVISYYYENTQDLKICKCGNAACSSGNTITTVDSADSVGADTWITIGSDGLPVVSYNDNTNTALKVLHCGNAACSSGNTATTADNTAATGRETTITIADDGFPVIAHMDVVASYMYYTKCGDLTCSKAYTRLLDNSVTAAYARVAIGIDGNPIMSYPGSNAKFAKCYNLYCLPYWTRR